MLINYLSSTVSTVSVNVTITVTIAPCLVLCQNPKQG